MIKSIVSQAIFSITLCARALFIILICGLCTMKFFLQNGIKTDSKKLQEVENLKRSYILVSCLKWAASVK